MKVLVTGHCGQVGKLLLPELARLGYEVFGYDRELGLDIEDRKALSENLRGMDAVIHLAGIRGPEFLDRSWGKEDKVTEETYERINYEGSVTVFEEAHKAGIKHFVFSSSNDVYGLSEIAVDDIPWPITDETPTVATNPYAKNKLKFAGYMKKNASKYGMSAISLRIGGFVGGPAPYPWHASEGTVITAFDRALKTNRKGFQWHNIADVDCPVKSDRTDKFMGRGK